MTNVIELAKKCGASVAYIESDGENKYYFTEDELQAFYDAAQKEQEEKDAVLAWSHY